MNGSPPRWALVPVMLCFALLRPAEALAQRDVYGSSSALELDSATTAGVLLELQRASSRGLPTEPLLAKAREGRLKHAPGGRIRQAVAALSVRLDSARSALGASARPDELVAGADAIAAGASTEALRTLRASSGQRSVSVALGALAQLVASGVPTRRATAMIVELMRRNIAASAVIAFGNAVETDAAGGLPPEESAIFRLRAASGAAFDALTSASGPSAINGTGTAAGTPRGATPHRRP